MQEEVRLCPRCGNELRKPLHKEEFECPHCGWTSAPEAEPRPGER